MSNLVSHYFKCLNPSCPNPNPSKMTPHAFRREKLKEMLKRDDVQMQCSYCDQWTKASPKEIDSLRERIVE